MPNYKQAVFVYGTLKTKVLAEAILQRKVEYKPAILEGYKVYNTTDHYPTIVEEDGSVAEGLIIDNITETELGRLDYYEGYPVFYNRKQFVAKLKDGGNRTVWIYQMNDPVLLRGE